MNLASREPVTTPTLALNEIALELGHPLKRVSAR